MILRKITKLLERQNILDELSYNERKANALGWIHAGHGTATEYISLIPVQYRRRLKRYLSQTASISEAYKNICREATP